MINWLEKNRKISLFLVFLVALEIFYFSSLEGNKVPNSSFYLSIIYHFSVFFLLNFFMMFALNGKKFKFYLFLLAISISLIYSLFDEIHQVFVPLRDASLNDVLINNLGIFFSSLVYVKIKREMKTKKLKNFTS